MTHKPGPKMQCWGWEGKCDAVLEDSSEQGMKAAGWGFMQARDDFAPGGTGAYFACPAHKSPST